MGVTKQPAAVMQAQAFPNAVTGDEAAVEHRDDGLGARHQLAVEPDQHVIVARIFGDILAAGHQARSRLSLVIPGTDAPSMPREVR
jgi:hypothetical protein